MGAQPSAAPLADQSRTISAVDIRLDSRWLFRAGVATAVALLAAGGVSFGSDTGAARTTISKERAIRIALAKLGNHGWFAPFPRTVGRTECQIPGGGIVGASIPGYCQTRVAVGRNYVTVAFTEVWDSEAFDGAGGRSNGPLSHTWIVIESRKLRPLDVSTFGDFPPQWVR
jgi:hypothetical protein